VANILIIEPHPEVCDLLLRIVRRLGHEPVVHEPAKQAVQVDVVLVEPAAEGGLEAAHAVKAGSGAAVVCVSIYPPSQDALSLEPVAYLLKPFSLLELERALLAALAPVEAAPSV
jgi:CheY-like chemotaxis protein